MIGFVTANLTFKDKECGGRHKVYENEELEVLLEEDSVFGRLKKQFHVV